jgi:LmbE family N-acetylglucosaminyl deacetylase
VAHPDDEYAFAAVAYRLTHGAQGIAEQIIITNGEAGFRYSQLAKSFYGLRLTDESIGRDRLPAIRRQEAERAGQILGIRRHWFLEQRDARFTLDSREAFSGVWDKNYVTEFITTKLKQEQYDFVVVMLPTEQTHGHHQATALIAAEAIGRLPVDRRPVLIAAEASATEPPAFRARPYYPVLRSDQAPRWRVNRLDPLPDQPSLNYNVVVNWAIAEHKSQGLFPMEAGRHAFENCWLFDTDTPNATQKADDLFASLKYQIRSRR